MTGQVSGVCARAIHAATCLPTYLPTCLPTYLQRAEQAWQAAGQAGQDLQAAVAAQQVEPRQAAVKLLLAADMLLQHLGSRGRGGASNNRKQC